MEEQQHTPGRRGRSGNQYFDVGKVGRKTGIELKDTGIRDEHGMEPVSGIFSSPIKSPDKVAFGRPASIAREAQRRGDGSVQRRTPRLPPPRASTPRHTNIGSPKRMSSARPSTVRNTAVIQQDSTPTRDSAFPAANRVLDFVSNGVRKSIESPFRPKRALRRSTTPTANDPFASLDSGRKHPVREAEVSLSGTPNAQETIVETDDYNELPVDVEREDSYVVVENEDEEVVQTLQSSTIDEIEQAISHVEEVLKSPASQRRRTRQRKSLEFTNGTLVHHTPPAAQVLPSSSSDRKRQREHVEEVSEVDAPALESSPVRSVSGSVEPPQKKTRSSPAKSRLSIHQDADDSHIDPVLLDSDHSDEESEEPPTVAERSNPAKDKTPNRSRKTIAFADKDPNIAPTSRTSVSPVKFNDDGERQTKRSGSVDNFSRRMSTPFEDARQTSRSGRPIMKPLKYWAGEAYVWKHGEVDGIIRADVAQEPKKGKKKKRHVRRAKSADHGKGEDNNDKESDTESVLPDDWEQDIGVLGGHVAGWNSDVGVSEGTVREDIAFAASSLQTKEVAGSAFTYAKIMTLPFFGAGLVELPPEGYKRSKNSRKMQMVFFVHEGKVQVSVGQSTSTGGANAEEMNEFSISEGGVWVVPRGNNYAIINQSRSRTARIFFAQGCEYKEGA